MGEGSGGTENGRVESRLAVSAVLANFRSSDISDPLRRLTEALRHAAEVLYMRSQSSAAFRESSATCTAVLIRGSRLYAARIGTIQIGVIRQAQVRELFDHMNSGGFKDAAMGRVVTPEIEMLSNPVGLQDGDRVLLGNSVLFNLAGPEILRVGTTLVPAVAARRLIETVERSGERRPASVQIIQIGENRAMESRGLRNLDGAVPLTGTPVAPVVHQPTKTRIGSDIPSLGPLRTGLSLAEITSRKSLNIRAIAAVFLVALGSYWLWPSFVDSSNEQSSSEVSERQPFVDAGDVIDPLAGAPGINNNNLQVDSSFWVQVAEHLESDTGTIDSDQVRAWLGSQNSLEQRRLEAAALLAALNDIPISKDSQPIISPSVVSADSITGTAKPGANERKSSLETVLPNVVKPVPLNSNVAKAGAAKIPSKLDAKARFWHPKRLPTNLRKFEHIFAIKDRKEAAKRLKKYIHIRYRRVERVFDLIDAYLSVAPTFRSIEVLKEMRATKPGPKTRKWISRNLRRLKKAQANTQ